MYSAVAIFQVVDTPPGSFVANQFGFEEEVERLSEGVIVAVALGPDRGDSLGVGETVGVTNGSISASLCSLPEG
jgi:hypothetical protein